MLSALSACEDPGTQRRKQHMHPSAVGEPSVGVPCSNKQALEWEASERQHPC